jgi:hypothetical protein
VVVPVVPLGRGDRAQPAGRRRGERVQRGAHRLAHELDAVEGAHGRQHVRAVGALPRARPHQPALRRALEQPVEQELLGAADDQTPAELAQHAVVEAGVGQLERERVLPVDARAHRVGRLAVGEPL